mmetsp:Transcript_30260/g.54971  ORF Transcript_30260/g.54971 Transcript_30260/m.54971 type:complete len:142 (-) Transcript_30260:263-688(-)
MTVCRDLVGFPLIYIERPHKSSLLRSPPWSPPHHSQGPPVTFNANPHLPANTLKASKASSSRWLLHRTVLRRGRRWLKTFSSATSIAGVAAAASWCVDTWGVSDPFSVGGSSTTAVAVVVAAAAAEMSEVAAVGVAGERRG